LIGSKVHFHRGYFLCKSTTSHKAVCCNSGAAWPPKPAWRLAVVLAIYPSITSSPSPEDISILPWAFGRVVYQKLRDLTNTLNDSKAQYILKNDFLIGLSRAQNSNEIRAVPMNQLGSFWQSKGMKKEILSRAEPHFLTLNRCLGADLSEEEIQARLQEPAAIDRPRSLLSTRPARRNNSNDEGLDFLDSL